MVSNGPCTQLGVDEIDFVEITYFELNSVDDDVLWASEGLQCHL